MTATLAAKRPVVPADGGVSPLIFVYDAESGVMNAIIDVAHKICARESYRCTLCALTWSPVGMRRRWKNFIARLGRPVEFLHSDELATKYAVSGVALPAVFERTAAGVRPWIPAERLRECRTLDDLEQLVRTTLGAAA